MTQELDLDSKIFSELVESCLYELVRHCSADTQERKKAVEHLVRDRPLFNRLIKDLQKTGKSPEAVARGICWLFIQSLSVGERETRQTRDLNRLFDRVQENAKEIAKEFGTMKLGPVSDLMNNWNLEVYKPGPFSDYLPSNRMSAIQLFIFFLERFGNTPLPKKRKGFVHGGAGRRAGMSQTKVTKNAKINGRLLALSNAMRDIFERPFDERVVDLHGIVHLTIEKSRQPDWIDGRYVVSLRRESGSIDSPISNRLIAIGRKRKKLPKKGKNPRP